MIRFYCTQCGQKLKVPETYAGQECHCSACHTTLMIPSNGEESPPESAIIKFR